MQRTIKRLTLILDKTPEEHEDAFHIGVVLENVQRSFTSCRHLATGTGMATETALSEFANRFFWSRHGSEVVSILLHRSFPVRLGLLIGAAGCCC